MAKEGEEGSWQVLYARALRVVGARAASAASLHQGTRHRKRWKRLAPDGSARSDEKGSAATNQLVSEVPTPNEYGSYGTM